MANCFRSRSWSVFIWRALTQWPINPCVFVCVFTCGVAGAGAQQDRSRQGARRQRPTARGVAEQKRLPLAPLHPPLHRPPARSSRRTTSACKRWWTCCRCEPSGESPPTAFSMEIPAWSPAPTSYSKLLKETLPRIMLSTSKSVAVPSHHTHAGLANLPLGNGAIPFMPKNAEKCRKMPQKCPIKPNYAQLCPIMPNYAQYQHVCG